MTRMISMKLLWKMIFGVDYSADGIWLHEDVDNP